MDKIRIIGGNPLSGTIRISGAKNAMLPLMAASLLSDKTLILKNAPLLDDVMQMGSLLEQLGVSLTVDASGATRAVHLKAEKITTTTASYDIVRKMRASILVLGPLVARCGYAKVSLPGGCAIGVRPVDLHVKGLMAMGTEIELEDGYINARAPSGLKGADYTFPLVSVTGTENLLMAACLAKGTTILRNVAREPEITDLAHCLNSMGARISGIETDTLVIEGVTLLHEATYTVLPDRIETGTYAIAAAITGGEIQLIDTDFDLLPGFTSALELIGVKLARIANGILVTAPAGRPQATDIITAPFPGFATDLQAQIMALLTIAKGQSCITETIWENRFMHVPELMRMNADIQVEGSRALVTGVKSLKGAQVMATDLRASVSLVLAGLAAKGETVISRVYHLDRGYENLEAKLSACGAQIERVKVDEAA
ncbi:MAG: UDP-N-acetylglucosamine 1-carboxyvinyltransferase [Alphaproteobacteria bacterium]|nr:UDP-N-acetylglucosamine 1-carboxyvinyltransferase [Alphaproteobacteria bacterium]